jgi:ribosomal protein S18 acetylase RimI-like enzyme
VEIRPFGDEHLDGAATLLAERHGRHRAAEPLLADSNASEAVARAWEREEASGAVVLEGGKLVGYLVGALRENRIWGRHAWVERAGHAAAEPELVRDLYAAAAPAWAEAGAQMHFALVPVLDEVLEPWYRLAFGQVQLEAIRESGSEPAPLAPGVTIRRAGIDDLETAAMPLAKLIWQHQALSPCFTGLTPPPEEELRSVWQETLEDSDVVYFVVEREGGVVAHSVLYPAASDLGTPDDALYLGTTATMPEVRGTGIGLSLTEHVLFWAREAGYPTVVTDWRVANLLASRFWPARGFRPTFVRVYRRLGLG